MVLLSEEFNVGKLNAERRKLSGARELIFYSHLIDATDLKHNLVKFKKGTRRFNIFNEVSPFIDYYVDGKM